MNTLERLAAYNKLVEGYTIFRVGDTIVNSFGNTFTVTHTVISGYELRVVANDYSGQAHTFKPEDIRKS